MNNLMLLHERHVIQQIIDMTVDSQEHRLKEDILWSSQSASSIAFPGEPVIGRGCQLAAGGFRAMSPAHWDWCIHSFAINTTSEQ